MNTKKSIALFDLDMTIFKEYSIFSLTKYLVKEKILEEYVFAKMLEKSKEYKDGLISYSETAVSLLQIWAESLKDVNYNDVKEKTKDFFEENIDKFYSYFEQLLPELKKTHVVYLVTAGPQFVSEAIKEKFEMDGFLSTEFEVLDGKFTGSITSSLADGKQIVGDLLSKYEGDNFAFGDSENDIGMLERVKNPVCINPTEKLLELAKERGWLVVSDAEAYEKVAELLNK
jgi:HAD superfamily phosphoserine phosphatase-like hydrolase